jgi:hypothetical protein
LRGLNATAQPTTVPAQPSVQLVTEGQTNTQTYWRTKHNDRQTDRQAGRQIHRQTETDKTETDRTDEGKTSSGVQRGPEEKEKAEAVSHMRIYVTDEPRKVMQQRRFTS